MQNVNEPILILGTAFSFVHLLDFLCEQNRHIQLPSGSHVLETGGYKGRSRSLPKPELHSLITGWLGIPASHIVCEYGMSDLGPVAFSHGKEIFLGRDFSSERNFSEAVRRHAAWP